MPLFPRLTQDLARLSGKVFSNSEPLTKTATKAAIKTASSDTIKTTAKLGESVSTSVNKIDKVINGGQVVPNLAKDAQRSIDAAATVASKPLVGRALRQTVVGGLLVGGTIGGASYLAGKGIGTGLTDVISGWNTDPDIVNDTQRNKNEEDRLKNLGDQLALMRDAQTLGLTPSEAQNFAGATTPTEQAKTSSAMGIGTIALIGAGVIGAIYLFKKKKGTAASVPAININKA